MQIRPHTKIIHAPYTNKNPVYLVNNALLDYVHTYMHYHDTLEIGYTLRGSGTFCIGEQITPFHAGDVSIVLPGELHISNSAKQDRAEWAYIIADLHELFRDSAEGLLLADRLLYQKPLAGQVFAGDRHTELVFYVRQLLRELSQTLPDSRTAVKMLVLQLLLYMGRFGTAATGSARQKNAFHMVAPAVSYLSSHYTEMPASSDLAALCFMSQTHFRRLFKTALGVSPHEYLYRVRINAAVALLQDKKMTVTEIYGEVGYQSASSFHRHFKKFTGRSPRELMLNAEKDFHPACKHGANGL